jgi:hypothetical protein
MSDEETETGTEAPPEQDEDAPITEEQVADAEQEDAPADETPDEPDVLDQAQQAATEREIEADQKRLDRAIKAYLRVATDVFAKQPDLVEPCPRCADDYPGLIIRPAFKQVLPETRAAVMISMGEDPDPTLNPDPRANRCGTCDGWGKVATGSRVARQDKLECTECQGRGWIGPRAATLTANGSSYTTIELPPTSADSEPSPATDPWGRVKGEALYGVMPGFES